MVGRRGGWSVAPAVGVDGGPPGGGVSVAAPWSFAGHSIVCEIAFQRLTDQGRALVFVTREHDPDPSGTFFESCSWADQSRYGDHRATYEYHFMNVVVPGADEMVMERDCANYDCVQLAGVRYATEDELTGALDGRYFQAPDDCNNGQVLKWDGRDWACSDDTDTSLTQAQVEGYAQGVCYDTEAELTGTLDGRYLQGPQQNCGMGQTIH